MEFQIVKASDGIWDDVVRASVNADFYHTRFYHVLEEGNGEAVLLLGSIDNDFIGFPLLISDIPNTNYKDATSVYGYCGPISNRPIEYFSKDILTKFSAACINYFTSNNIISVFSRLHPYFDSSNLFEGFGRSLKLNPTVSVDLTLNPLDQFKLYSRNNRNLIRSLQKNQFFIREARTPEDIACFHAIYHENMKRVNASSKYYFSLDYLYTFINNDSFEVELLLATYNNEIVAGGIFTFYNSLVQYHLSATKDEYLKLSPIRLVIDEARKKGVARHCNYLHLGGGRTKDVDDSLLKFKKQFSQNLEYFSVWQLIVDRDVYDELSDFFSSARNNSNNDYFPLYRNI